MESVAALPRNEWQHCYGISARLGAEYSDATHDNREKAQRPERAAYGGKALPPAFAPKNRDVVEHSAVFDNPCANGIVLSHRRVASALSTRGALQILEKGTRT